jgi:hypothetical protein
MQNPMILLVHGSHHTRDQTKIRKKLPSAYWENLIHLFTKLVFTVLMVASRSIIWSPHNDRNQFLVSGAELKLYEWVPEVLIDKQY